MKKKRRVSINMTCVLCKSEPPRYYVRSTGQCCYSCMMGVTQLADYPKLQEGLDYEIAQGHVVPLTEEGTWKGFIL